jgi:hypothetical protein
VTAERVLILYEGVAPAVREINELVRVVERETGVDLLGVRVTTFPTAEATDIQAQFLVTRLEKESRLAPAALHRTTTYTAEAAPGRRVVAAVWAVERNPWVRDTIPPHLAKGSGLRLARRPGWARLASEPALGFVASADDGTARCFPDVHVVVSLLPEASPRRVRRLLPGGYLRWVDGVFRVAGTRLGVIDVAHWLVCVNGRRRTVHLAYLANDRRESALLPWELLTRDERHGDAKLA